MDAILRGFGGLLILIGLAVVAWGVWIVGSATTYQAVATVFTGGGIIAAGAICWGLGAILDRLTEIRDRLPRS